MKKYIIALVLVISWLFSLSKANNVLADWWLRPTALPTQPTFGRDLPPSAVDIRPTLAGPTATPNPVHPTAAPTGSVVPTNPPTGGTPSNGGGTGSNDDPCASGKSFVGPNCGWSPNVDNSGSGSGNGGSSTSRPRVGSGPQVLGLSNTSGSDLALSDIMILAGVLCLSVYARSKIKGDQSH